MMAGWQVLNSRVWLFLAASVAAVGIAFAPIPAPAALTFVKHYGFWFVLAAFILFVRALWRTFREQIVQFRQWRIDWASVAIVIAGSTVLLVHEACEFKIVMDELMLLGTSMSMHLEKTVLTPTRGNDIQGVFVLMDGLLDKRPLFFPFLLSLLHDLSGYRPANAFILNAGLTFLFQTLVYAAGRRLGGRHAGWLGVLLFAGLPLLGQNATGGGFELLNLVMILGTLLLGARWIERRDGPSLEAFCFSALLLMQVRYESVIYLLPVTLLVLYGWYSARRPLVTWPMVVAPLLVVHYPMHHRIFDVRASAWELASRPGYDVPFALKYVPDNIGHALAFFFAKASDHPNSLVLSALGFIAVPFFALLVIKKVRSLRGESAMSAATIIFAFGFVAQFALLMCYFWGQFDEVVIRRLSLPTHLGMGLAILAVAARFVHPAVMRALLVVAAVGLVARSVPAMAAHAYNQQYLPGRETAWRRQFIGDQPRNDYLMIDNDTILWVAHKVSATMTEQVANRLEVLAFHMRNRTYSDVYVFQRFNIDEHTGAMTVRKFDALPPNFILETVREERLQFLTLTRISRVKEIREGGAVVSTPDPGNHVVPKSRKEIEERRRQYLEHFIKMLP